MEESNELTYLLRYEKPISEAERRRLLETYEKVSETGDETTGVLVVRGKLSVHEATYYMSVMRDKKLREADNAYVAAETKPDSVEQILEALWCSLSSCSKGQVPTANEFIHHMDDMDSEAWGVLVGKINPHWFGEEKKRVT